MLIFVAVCGKVVKMKRALLSNNTKYYQNIDKHK